MNKHELLTPHQSPKQGGTMWSVQWPQESCPMKTRPFSLLLLAALALAGLPAAHAEKADRNKPMNIEADALRHDELKQTSVFTGRVVMTKGSIVLRGAQLQVRQDPDGFQYGVVTPEPGKRAFFRQKRDTQPGQPDEFVEGEGEVIEYKDRKSTRLNSSHYSNSYADFCLKKKKG